MNNLKLWYSLFLTLLLINGNAYGFDLFNADRGKPPPPPQPTVTETPPQSLPIPFTQARPSLLPPPPTPQAPLLPQKDYELRGISIIGSKKAVILKSPDGKEFVQHFKDNKRTPINDPSNPDPKTPTGYFLINVEARKIVVEYPENAPCRQNNDVTGIECNNQDGGKTVTLKRVRRNAIAAAPPPPPQPVITPFPPAPTPASPEETKAQEEERKRREQLYKNFQRQVIKDEDVPPGMRVVRTPFGDRLVPIR
jgi:hypothetical protein